LRIYRQPFPCRSYENSEINWAIDHFIHPLRDFIGSDTLYVKVLYVDYDEGFAIIEMLGEWNDTLHNDVMHLKRNLIDGLVQEGVKRFLMIGENVLNFHGLEDDYYQEWFEDVEDGWIVTMGFREFIHREWNKYRLDYYLNWGGNLEVEIWRTLSPQKLVETIDREVRRRIG
jgi:hypothetical protein